MNPLSGKLQQNPWCNWEIAFNASLQQWQKISTQTTHLPFQKLTSKMAFGAFWYQIRMLGTSATQCHQRCSPPIWMISKLLFPTHSKWDGANHHPSSALPLKLQEMSSWISSHPQPPSLTIPFKTPCSSAWTPSNNSKPPPTLSHSLKSLSMTSVPSPIIYIPNTSQASAKP